MNVLRHVRALYGHTAGVMDQMRLAPLWRHSPEHFRGDTDCREACGDILDDERIRGDHCSIANSYRPNDTRLASDVDMIANGRPAWSRSCANGAHVINCAVSPDLGSAMHSDRATMRDDQPWSDLSVGVNVDQCHHHE